MKDSPKQQIAFFESEVKDILGKPPGYLIKWGISLYGILFCIVLILSATVQYPEYLKCKAIVQPTNTAQIVYLSSNQHVIGSLPEDGRQVKAQEKILDTNEGAIKSIENGTVKHLKAFESGVQNTINDTIMKVVPELQDYELILNVPHQYINQIKINQRISFAIDTKIIDGKITSIPTQPNTSGFFQVSAISESNETYLSHEHELVIDILIENKKIFHKILNL